MKVGKGKGKKGEHIRGRAVEDATASDSVTGGSSITCAFDVAGLDESIDEVRFGVRGKIKASPKARAVGRFEALYPGTSEWVPVVEQEARDDGSWTGVSMDESNYFPVAPFASDGTITIRYSTVDGASSDVGDVTLETSSANSTILP